LAKRWLISLEAAAPQRFNMTELIDHLPGQKLPVKAVAQSLRQMWDSDEGDSPSQFRASQMNVILHLGLGVQPAELQERFQALVRFVQRYPGRIIVLCPSAERANGSMLAKLFSQCYIGPSQREMCCCEALMLAYEPKDYQHLANQVSVWLEADLPTYHWLSGVRVDRVGKYFNNLLKDVRRCVYDSSIESPEYCELEWPQPRRVRDLAQARLLPIRQFLGQFLSGYPMDQLRDGLEGISVEYATDQAGEAQRLGEWLAGCLGLNSDAAALISQEACADTAVQLAMEWSYGDGRYLKWQLFREGSRAEIEIKFGDTVERIPTHLKPLAPEQALAEAFFF
jgi:hypothetical protein